jgi:hypothetical protein
MRTHLPTITLALALMAGAAAAQQQPPAPAAQDQPPAPDRNPAPPGVDPAQQNAPQPGYKPEQGGKQEPGSRAATAAPEDARPLVDGKLNVPGAPANSDTVPAKFSAKNDADDKTITLGYTFKDLTPEQKKAIYQVVSAGGAKPSGADLPPKVAEVGATLPPLYPVEAFPEQTTSQVGQTERYRYTIVGDKLLLVDPTNMIVVGVIGPQDGK